MDIPWFFAISDVSVNVVWLIFFPASRFSFQHNNLMKNAFKINNNQRLILWQVTWTDRIGVQIKIHHYDYDNLDSWRWSTFRWSSEFSQRFSIARNSSNNCFLSYLERNFVAVSPSQNVFTRLDTNWYDKDKTTVQYFKYQMTAKILTHTLIEHETKVQGPTTPMARMNDTWTTLLQPMLRRTEVSYNNK